MSEKYLKDVLSLMANLPQVDKRAYSAESRAKDFIAVFRGQSSAEQGARVLAWIHGFCEPSVSPLDADKPGTLAFKEGQRWVMAQILRAFIPLERITAIESEKRTRRDARIGND